MILFLVACISAETVDVWIKTEQETVELIIDSISLRATGQAWYQDWHLLDPVSDHLSITPEYQIIANGLQSHTQYHHIFIDAHSAFINGVEIADILEPISLDSPLTDRHSNIYVDAVVLEAPRGPSIFLRDASCQ